MGYFKAVDCHVGSRAIKSLDDIAVGIILASHLISRTALEVVFVDIP